MEAVCFRNVVCSLSTIVTMETILVNAADTADIQPCQKPISYKNIFVPQKQVIYLQTHFIKISSMIQHTEVCYQQ